MLKDSICYMGGMLIFTIKRIIKKRYTFQPSHYKKFSIFDLAKNIADFLGEQRLVTFNTIPKKPEMILLRLNLEAIDKIDRSSLWYLLTAVRL